MNTWTVAESPTINLYYSTGPVCYIFALQLYVEIEINDFGILLYGNEMNI